MIVVGNNPLAPTYTPHRGSNITMVIIFEIIHIQPRPLFVIWRIEIIQSAVGHRVLYSIYQHYGIIIMQLNTVGKVGYALYTCHKIGLVETGVNQVIASLVVSAYHSALDYSRPVGSVEKEGGKAKLQQVGFFLFRLNRLLPPPHVHIDRCVSNSSAKTLGIVEH